MLVYSVPVDLYSGVSREKGNYNPSRNVFDIPILGMRISNVKSTPKYLLGCVTGFVAITSKYVFNFAAKISKKKRSPYNFAIDFDDIPYHNSV